MLHVLFVAQGNVKNAFHGLVTYSETQAHYITFNNNNLNVIKNYFYSLYV